MPWNRRTIVMLCYVPTRDGICDIEKGVWWNEKLVKNVRGKQNCNDLYSEDVKVIGAFICEIHIECLWCSLMIYELNYMNHSCCSCRTRALFILDISTCMKYATEYSELVFLGSCKKLSVFYQVFVLDF